MDLATTWAAAWSLLTCTDSLAWRCTAVLCGLGLACVGQRLGGLLVGTYFVRQAWVGVCCFAGRREGLGAHHGGVHHHGWCWVVWLGWVLYCMFDGMKK